MYTIRFDPQEHVLHLTLSDFWTEATLALFTAEMVAKATALRRDGRPYGVLSDSRNFPVQSPAVAQGFERLMAAGAKAGAGPTAVVVASTLNKLQAERSLAGGRVRVFLDEGEARAWLAAELA